MILAAIAIAWFAFGKAQVERLRFYSFDPGQWANANFGDRYFMAKYLIDNGELVGKTKDQVSTMLGNADRDGDVMMLYKLGPERGSFFRVEDDWLEIRLGGPTDRLLVVSARIRPD